MRTGDERDSQFLFLIKVCKHRSTGEVVVPVDNLDRVENNRFRHIMPDGWYGDSPRGGTGWARLLGLGVAGTALFGMVVYTL